MSSSSAGSARIKAPSWKDPRLLIGVLLVLASVAGVVAVVSYSSRTTQVWAASRDIGTGEVLTADAMHKVEVALNDVNARYLPGSVDLRDRIALSAVRKDELIPAGSIGSGDQLSKRRIAIKLDTPLPAGARKGDAVDVWVAEAATVIGAETKAGSNRAIKVASGAELADLSQQGGAGIGFGAGATIFVLVSESEVSQIVNAQAAKSTISVIWRGASGS